MAGCEVCHATTAKSERAGLPETVLCMSCHSTVRRDAPPIRRLAAFQQEARPIPWVRVYKLPDYVFFSHARHVGQGRLECAACHGPVARRDQLARERPIHMKSCVDCHKARSATIACNACHELGQ